jgi:DNA-binding SARP family transcriptional activator/tetratricopeptide (TPR) repeat protein
VVEFRILGSLDVVVGGESRPIGRRQERVLLALLLLAAGPLRAEQLVAGLWGETPPAQPRDALRVYLSRLRHCLAADGEPEMLVSQRDGYRLNRDDTALDATRFEALTADGRRRAATGDPAGAAMVFGKALSLWRGPALSGLGDVPPLAAEAARLEEARLVATEERWEAELAGGGHRAVIGELEALTRVHPFRERCWELRMLALYRAGRQAEALRAYQELRRFLSDEVGLEPSPSVSALETAIHRRDPVLDWGSPPPAAARDAAHASAVAAGPSSTSPRADSPAALARRTPFVGRAGERATLRALLHQAAAGTGGLVMIGGEPGVGKTRLAEEAANDAGDGVDVFFGHCPEQEGAAPYGALAEVLETALARAPSAEAFRELLGDEAPEVARLLPRLRRLWPDLAAPLELPAEEERRYFFNCVCEVLTRSSRRRPVLLVVEDLHWADEGTFLFLAHLTERLAGMAVLVVATYRDTEIGAGLTRVSTELRRRGLALWIPLLRLPEETVVDLLRALGGREPPASLVRVLYAETEGNPFFLEEVYRHLVEEGRLFDSDGRFRSDVELAELDVPEGVRLVVGRRIERLGADGARALAAAAVIGRVFSFELLDALAEVDPKVLLEVVEETERARLVRHAPDLSGEDRFMFAHELVRQTVLAGLSAPRRRKLHARVADAMEQHYAARLDEHAALIAHHLQQAGAEEDRVFRYLRLGGKWALDGAAFEEAHRLYEAALAASGGVSPADRAQLLFEVGMARRGAGYWDTAIAAWRQALDGGDVADVETVGRVCLAATFSFVYAGRSEDGVEMAERGLAALGRRTSPTRVRLLAMAAFPAGYAGRYEQSNAWIEEAVDLAREMGDDALLGYALMCEAMTRLSHLEADRVIEAGRRGAELLRRSGDPWGATSALVFVANALPFLGRLDEARRLTGELAPEAERLGHTATLMQIGRINACADWFDRPDPDAVEAFARRDFELCQRSGMRWISNSWTWLGLAQFLRGRWEEALPLLEEGVRLEPPGALQGWDSGHLLDCLAYLGRRAEFLAFLETRALPQPGRPTSSGGATTLCSAVEGLTILGEHARAAELYPAVVGCFEGTGMVGGGYIDLRLGERVAAMAAAAGRRWDAAEAHFRKAMAEAERIPHRPEQAHTRRFYGQMLLDRDGPGDGEMAQKLLAAAAADYGRIGMPRHQSLAAMPGRGDC